MAIDTDELSDEVYEAIIGGAEEFNHDLTLQFGVLSYRCSDENDYIKKSKMLIKEMLRYDKDDIHDLFYGNPPPKKQFHDALNKILENIANLKK
jgi:hypothetical protein